MTGVENERRGPVRRWTKAALWYTYKNEPGTQKIREVCHDMSMQSQIVVIFSQESPMCPHRTLVSHHVFDFVRKLDNSERDAKYTDVHSHFIILSRKLSTQIIVFHPLYLDIHSTRHKIRFHLNQDDMSGVLAVVTGDYFLEL